MSRFGHGIWRTLLRKASEPTKSVRCMLDEEAEDALNKIVTWRLNLLKLRNDASVKQHHVQHGYAILT